MTTQCASASEKAFEKHKKYLLQRFSDPLFNQKMIHDQLLRIVWDAACAWQRERDIEIIKDELDDDELSFDKNDMGLFLIEAIRMAVKYDGM